MKTLCVAINSKFSHSSLALRYFREYAGCDIFECSVNDDIFNVYLRLLNSDYEALIFGIYIWNREYTLKLISMLKSISCKKIFAGGPEAGFDSVNMLRGSKDIDGIIQGEGEDAIFAIKEGKDFKNIPNLTYRSRGEIIHNKREYVALEKIPFPYKQEDLKELENKIIYFETSRGCIFNCSYCLSSSEGKTRYFPMEYVKKGISFFINNKVPLVKFVDRTFNDSKERSLEILKYIVDNNRETVFHFEIAPMLICDEFKELLKKSRGKIQVEAGIQTTNEATMREIGRVYNKEKVRENLLKIRDYVHLHTDLIAGLPYETYESFKEGFNYAYEMKPHMLQLGFLKLLKNTRMKENADKYGIRATSFPPFEVLKTNHMSDYDLWNLKLVEKALDKLYNSGGFKKTLNAIEGDNPFETYLALGKEIYEREKNGPIKRTDLYDMLYDVYKDKIKNALVEDFLVNNEKAPLPQKLKEDYDKAVFKELCKEEEFLNKKIRVEKVGNHYFVLCQGKVTIK